jgi:ABC-type polysaccharide/polyol phosphate transport system ATPase subunit
VLWLEHGKVRMFGSTDDVLRAYERTVLNQRVDENRGIETREPTASRV